MAIREWFAGKEILLTGVTCDIGYAVLEKLLRSCPEIKRIYVIVRSKNALSKDERVEKIFQSSGFQRLRQEFPNAMSLMTILEGNLVYEQIGLTEEQMNLLKNVSVVIHAGGPHEPLLEMCSELPSLSAAIMAENIFKKRGQITESVHHEKLPNIPLAMVRIPAVGPALKEPMPGYVTVLKGATALIVGAGYALGDANLPAAIVPVDMVANTLIAAAWSKSTSKQRGVTVYNVPALNCTWDTLIKSGSKASKNFSYPSFGIRGMTARPWLHWFVVLVLEWLPSVLCDAFLFAAGCKPSIVDDHIRVQSLLQSMRPILSKSWTGDQKNVQELNNELTPDDQEEFFVHVDIDLETYVLCGAAAVKKTCVIEKNLKIITNFKRIMFAAFVMVLFFVFYMR